MSGDLPAGAFSVGSRVNFPYGGSRRTGTVSDVSPMPDGRGGSTVMYLIDVGQKKILAPSEGVTAAGEGPAQFDAVAEGVAYGRRRPRNTNRRR